MVFVLISGALFIGLVMYAAIAASKEQEQEDIDQAEYLKNKYNKGDNDEY